MGEFLHMQQLELNLSLPLSIANIIQWSRTHGTSINNKSDFDLSILLLISIT